MNESVIIGPSETSSSLPEVYLWGIDFIKLIQQIENPALTSLVKFITALGSAYFFLPAIILIFWLIDEKRGFNLGVLIIVSAWINIFLKEVFKQPRPFHIEASVGLAATSGFGIPSGHAQTSIIFWVSMAAWLSQAYAEKKQKQLAIWTLAFFIVLLIGFTRLYLGVHFPTDLLAGWAIGLAILALWFFPGGFLAQKLALGGIRAQNIAVAVAALIMNGLIPADRTLPALFLGFCLGYNTMKQRFPFSAQPENNGKKTGAKTKTFRCLTGFAGTAILFLALRLILPGEGSLFGSVPLWGDASPFYETGDFIRYGLLGFWVSAGAPRLFQQMGLAK